VLSNIDIFLCQTDRDRTRLIDIGAPAGRVQVSGNLKFDVPLPPAPPIVASLRDAFDAASATPILVCGSTVQDEERLLLQAFQNVLGSYPRAVMILAPRHPERFGEVSSLLDELGLKFWRRSLWGGDRISGGVLLIDSIGELAALYALADIAFVGGSLVPRGGHNIIEPALHGVAIVVGNHMENFREIVNLFHSRDAVRVVGPAELPLAFMELISHPEQRRALGQRATETLRSQMGATERTVEALRTILLGQAS
jgi:3-deoxy-D-manno-octulosonic-acid transferase